MASSAAQNVPVWLITGTSNGMGLALSQLVLKQGHRLVSVSRRANADDSLLQLANNSTLSHVQLDLANPDPVYVKGKAMEALAAFEAIDFVVNMAGTTTFSSFEHLESGTLQTVMQTNFYSPLYIIQALLPHMRETAKPDQKKVIVNVSSTQGITSDPSETAYDASKHALEAMTEVLAVEVAPFNIRTLLVLPGAFKTNLVGASAEHRHKPASDASQTAPNELGLFPPYDASNHPVQQRMAMVAKYGIGGARGDPMKAARVIFDVVMQDNEPGRVASQGEHQESELSLVPGKGGASCERVVLGPDAWVKLKAKTQRMTAWIDRWETVSATTDLDGWSK